MRLQNARAIVTGAASGLGQHFAGIPVGRIGNVEEIWLAVKFIIECDFFTGRMIEVDGGASF
jgi:3-oxoacyl-[acyl-carrier protein] reductase